MIGITVCVGYDDLLEITLPRAMQHFDQVTVVTSEDEVWVGTICGRPVGRYRTDVLYRHGASFNKGAALEEALAAMKPSGWICHFDADILLPKEMDLSAIQPGHLYIPRRRVCRNAHEYTGQTDWSQWPLMQELYPFDCGCFQLFHAEDPVLATRPWYPVHWKHAGGSDTEFNGKWSDDKRHYLPFEVLHLGEPYMNWHGRQTRRLDGTLPEGAELSARRLAEMRALRRKHGYEKERIGRETT
ncbi:MAG: hypothetical protein ACYSWU_10105 [Planctomycetota bacterium]